MSWGQNRRESLACRSGHKTESVEPTVEAREGRTEQRNVRKKNFTSHKNLVTQCPLKKNSSEAVWVQLCSAWNTSGSVGNDTTERNTAEMRGCHEEEGRRKRRSSTHGLLRKCQPPA